MSEMISVASGFQYSVNIAYDLNDEDKIKNFIPTGAALQLLEDILRSTEPSSTERARILIGAYGKGKSHIVLVILSLLMKKNVTLFERILAKSAGTALYQRILNYYEGDDKILPIVVTGSNASLTQSFLMALQRALSENDLLDLLPDTNYRAAISTIQRWECDFPETYRKFSEQISAPMEQFIDRLQNFDVCTYEEFERIYPNLTAGGIFNPFLGFDVVELYESAAKALRERGYTGLYIVYDEFSKYLEANITTASISDIKTLQDFAEKCNRSAALQLHIMLISHKEIANYIDVLPKQKVDGWRGVSERFLHVRLNNNFTQTYEVIESVIQKKEEQWNAFCTHHAKQFRTLEERYITHPAFSGMFEEDVKKIIFGGYPLHPMATFILPRLSERVAQNERTLFTFLSAPGVSTLPTYLRDDDDRSFQLITPDQIYDYFEPLFKKEVYSRALHENYILTEIILEQLEGDSLEAKIVKSISLIYILEHYERIKPTKGELFGIFSVGYSHEEIDAAINALIRQEYVIYLKRSNHYLQLKQSSGVDIHHKIGDVMARQRQSISAEDVLNDVNPEKYLYPSRYNDAHEMIRYFSFHFIGGEELAHPENLISFIHQEDADGVIFGVLPENQDTIAVLREKILSISAELHRAVFILPRKYAAIESPAREYKAVMELREQAAGDRILFDEYEVVYEDLRALIVSFVAAYTHPELYGSYYIFGGKEEVVHRKAALSELLSRICDGAYARTPVINNEALNRKQATSIARNSRHKVVSALLRTVLEPNLGLSGTGQDVSIMRSTLIRTGVLVQDGDMLRIDLHPADNPLMSGVLSEIESFIREAREEGVQSFTVLYSRLCSAERHIAMRRELVPLYLALVLREYKQQIAIYDANEQVLLTADTITQINTNPENYSLRYLDWTSGKQKFVQEMERLFGAYIIPGEQRMNSYHDVIAGMRKWYVSLPKYAKEMRMSPDGEEVPPKYSKFVALLRQNPSGYALLFVEMPQAFGFSESDIGVMHGIHDAKLYYDEALDRLRESLGQQVKRLFLSEKEKVHMGQVSLTSIIKDWCERLEPEVFEHLFTDGTDRCLALFRAITHDEDTFLTRLARETTELRLEDWNDHTLEKCMERLRQYKTTAEDFHWESRSAEKEGGIPHADSYQVVFTPIEGAADVRRFDRVATSKRAGLLYNKIVSDLDSFGQAVTQAEKRQVLMDVLKKLC